MKKLLTFFALLAVMGIFSSPVQAQDVNNFTIESFEADYYIAKDEKNVAHLKVDERIVADFPSYDQNHGIERAIPKKYKKNNLNTQVESVKNVQGIALAYTTYDANDNLVVRIGDKNAFVHGRQVYHITYSMRDVISFEDGHDEWYWDVNGDQWRQTFGSVVAKIHIPRELAKRVNPNLTPRCFTGTYGGTDSDCAISNIDVEGGKLITISSKRGLYPGETMTFVARFEKGTFEKYQMDARLLTALLVGGALVFLGPPLCIFFLMWRRWRQTGKDPKGRGVIVPQYDVPEDLNPMLAEIILHERMTTKSISAAILELCVKGYLKLYETKKDKLIGSSTEYEIEIVKPTETLSAELLKVVSMVFGAKAAVGSRANLGAMKNQLYKEVQSLTKEVNQKVADQGYFMHNPEKARSKYTVWGIVLLVLGVSLAFIAVPYTLPLLGLTIAGLITLIFGNVMPKRTLEGVHQKEHLLGLKEYMGLAEAERIKFLQSPETAEKTTINPSDTKQLVQLYEKLLPYAMLFGIEKQWAKQFAHLYGAGQSPNWYSGNSAFNGIVLANALSGFSSVAASSFAAPSSSGSSGFSGGGFSGGGGGGGGGGGW